MVGGILLIPTKVFGLLFLGFIPGGSSNLEGRFPFPFEGSFLSSIFIFCFMDLKLTPYSTPIFFIYL